MRRVLFVIGATALGAVAIATSTVNAELDNQVFTSREHGVRMVVPRGWRATDQASYPGLLLWMHRTQPEGTMVLSAEPFTRQVYCSWPPECRMGPDPLPTKLACALRRKLTARQIRVGPTQAGPKENEKAGLPSVWFELDDGKRHLRQAVAVGEDQVVSLVLSASSADARNAHVRSFEQALRTLRPFEIEERAPGPQDIAIARTVPGDAGVDATVAPADAAPATVTTFASAPVSKLEPVGPCANATRSTR